MDQGGGAASNNDHGFWVTRKSLEEWEIVIPHSSLCTPSTSTNSLSCGGCWLGSALLQSWDQSEDRFQKQPSGNVFLWLEARAT